MFTNIIEFKFEMLDLGDEWNGIKDKVIELDWKNLDNL